MKYINLLIILVLCNLFLQAQDISQIYSDKNYFKIMKKYENEFEKNKDIKQKDKKMFMRWQWFWSSRVDSSGSLTRFNEELGKIDFNKLALAGELKSALVGNPAVNFQLVGPYSKPTGNDATGIGRFNCIWVNPANHNHILVGRDTSGLWRTYDGGSTWSNISMGYFTGGASDIAVDPNNINIIYLTSKVRPNGNFKWEDGYSMGVMKSTDGGTSWTKLTISFDADEFFEKVLIHPTNTSIVYALSNKKVYKSDNASSTWNIRFNGANGNLKDLLFKPNDPSVLYVSGINTLYKGINNGYNWFDIKGNLTSLYSDALICIATNSLNANDLYAYYKRIGMDASDKFEYSTNEGTTWNLKAQTNLYGRDFVMWVKLSFDGTVFLGGVEISRSTLAQGQGTSWTKELNSDQSGGDIHDDTRAITFPDPNNANLCFIATDGGIYKSTDAGSSWVNISGNLSANQFYSIEIADKYPDRMIGGRHDCASIYMDTINTWRHITGGDGGPCILDYENPLNYYASSNAVFVSYYNDSRIGTAAIFDSYGYPVVIDPFDPQYIYFSERNESIPSPKYQFKKCKSTNGILTETVLHAAWAPAYDIAVCHSDPKRILYTTYNIWSSTQKTNLYKTTDGVNFSEVDYSDLGTLVNNAPITDICINPLNPNVVWIAFGGFCLSPLKSWRRN